MRNILNLTLLLLVTQIAFTQSELTIVVLNKRPDYNVFITYTSRYTSIPNKDVYLLSDTNYFKHNVRDMDEYGKFILKVKTPEYNYVIKNFYPELNKNKIAFYVLDCNNIYYETRDYSDSIKTVQKHIADSTKEAQESEKRKDLVNRLSYIFNDALELYEKYYSNIDGRSYNKIADYLYDEGFSRSHDFSGSVMKDIYKIRWEYDADNKYNKDYIKFTISLWHSYGYGSLYYDINFDIYLYGYGNVIENGEKTSKFEALMK